MRRVSNSRQNVHIFRSKHLGVSNRRIHMARGIDPIASSDDGRQPKLYRIGDVPDEDKPRFNGKMNHSRRFPNPNTVVKKIIPTSRICD